MSTSPAPESGLVGRSLGPRFFFLQRLQLGAERVEGHVVALALLLGLELRRLDGVGALHFGRSALGALELRGEEVAHALRELFVEALDLRDLLGRRGADALERAEVREQRAL